MVTDERSSSALVRAKYLQIAFFWLPDQGEITMGFKF
jgi:hypothetical protein